MGILLTSVFLGEKMDGQPLFFFQKKQEGSCVDF